MTKVSESLVKRVVIDTNSLDDSSRERPKRNVIELISQWGRYAQVPFNQLIFLSTYRLSFD
jgi:hypothetical protein